MCFQERKYMAFVVYYRKMMERKGGVKMKGVLITAPAKGVGKSLVSCGLIELWNQSYNTVGFKCGPNYLDCAFQENLLGVPSANLDSFFLQEEQLRELWKLKTVGQDMAVLEGAGGYYDGIGGNTTKASAFDLSSILHIPSIMVIDMLQGTSISLAAVVKGFLNLRENSNIEGIILNRISKHHYAAIKEVLEKELEVPVLGYLPNIADITFSSRWDGMIKPEEEKDWREQIHLVSLVLKENLDMEKLFGIMEKYEAERSWESTPLEIEKLGLEKEEKLDGPVIAVAKDQAFCYLYEENLEVLKRMGAKLKFFSPLKDKKIPSDAQGLYLCGGYPEYHGAALSGNTSMRNSILKAIRNKMPTIAECGGFLYLHENLECDDGKIYPMVGAIHCNAYKGHALQHRGYLHMTAQRDTLILKKQETIPVHELHEYKSELVGKDYEVKRVSKKGQWTDGHGGESLYAGFHHLYFMAYPQVARAFLEKSAAWKS